MNMLKKLVALGVVSTMVLGSSITAFASTPTTTDLSSPSTAAGTLAGEEQTVEGAGTANYLFKKVFKVTVPTDTVANALFSYYTDPQGLLAATDAAQVGTNVSIADDTGVFFTNSVDGATVLSSVSDPLKIVNKSTSGVTIGMKVALTEGATAANNYAAGYSTTADFSGTGDGAKGLYLGIMTSGNKLTAITNNTPNSPAASVSVAKSSYPLYAVTYTSGAGYKFEIPSDSADASPVFEIYVTGALNKALADSTWYKVTDNQPLTTGAALEMPKITFKYTPTYIDAKMCKAAVDAENLYIWNYDDSMFKAGKDVTTVKINGTAVTIANLKTNADGLVVIPIANVYTGLGLTGDDQTFENVAAYIKSVEATVDSVAVYADVDV